MRFRLKAFGLHLMGSATALTLVLGTLYLGWYRWPGWYLCDAKHVVVVLMGVDLALGPLLTLVIASPRKPRRELARDVSIIVAVQLIALGYGSVHLWTGRPLYYALTENVVQVVQAYDINAGESALADKLGSPLRPHWYSLPRWIWVPPQPAAPAADASAKSPPSETDRSDRDAAALPALASGTRRASRAIEVGRLRRGVSADRQTAARAAHAGRGSRDRSAERDHGHRARLSAVARGVRPEHPAIQEVFIAQMNRGCCRPARSRTTAQLAVLAQLRRRPAAAQRLDQRDTRLQPVR